MAWRTVALLPYATASARTERVVGSVSCAEKTPRNNRTCSTSCIVVEILLLLGLNLENSIHVVVVLELCLLVPQRNHPSFDAHRLALCSVEVFCTPRQLFVVHIGAHVHLARVDLHDAGPGLLVGVGELDLPVKTTRPQKCRVKNIDSVGGRNDLDVVVGLESIKLIQELEHRPLHLTVSGLFRVEPLGSDRVELIDEDDGGRLFLCQRKRITDKLCAVTDEHLDQLRASKLQEGGVGLGGARPSHQRLPGTWRAIHQAALWWANSNGGETLLVLERQYDCLDQLFDLLVQPTNVGVHFLWLLVDLHRLHSRVVLGGQRVQDQVRVFVHAHQVCRLQILRWYQTNHWQEDRLSGRRLDDSRFALALRVQVNVCTVLG
eukprot:m.274576 g.274576  ORF g.274576 m.274576 type:complete len:377 (+) comp26901_c1_seq1:1639-2769(+)